MVTGLVLDDAGFEILAEGRRIGPRRRITADDGALLRALADRYVQAVHAHAGDATFVELGRELYAWLDGDQAQLSDLLTRVRAPATFEVRAPKDPGDQVWAVLRAPFEVLARPQGGFLAEDALLRFEVVRRLGRAETPPASDDLRLGLMFMASSPRGQFELDFEAEETAILDAVGDTRVDLVVEDTGDPEQLGHRLADLGGMPVVHLSCHGVNNWRASVDAPGVPVLMMEDEVGDGRPTSAPELVRLFSTPPRLVFVSACLTATGADARGHLPAGQGRRDLVPEPDDATAVIAHSMSTGLVTAGIPAVIGWDGSVTDVAATRFAEELYRRLGARADLAVAVGDARRALLAQTHAEVRADWHLARIWLGPTGGGPVVAGKRKRTLVSAVHGTKTFLDKKNQHVPVAAPGMFVGRRRELRRSLLTLRNADRAGVLLHGQGRLGKSSLAARIADRFNDRAVAVVFGDYTALGVLDAVAAAVTTNREARELVERRMPEVRDRPETLEALLIDLVSGPCAQSGPGRRPLLLIVDDLEQILEADPAGDHRVSAAHAPVVAAILRAFDPDETDSRLLFTSRFRFALNGLENRLEPIQLEPLSEASQRKLSTRQKALTTEDLRTSRKDLARRAVAVSHGNPGLQDLIALRLVYSDQVDESRAESVVAGMESYLSQGDLPSDAEVRGFLEALALDSLIDLAGRSNVALLRGLTLFDLPVPLPVAELLADRVGGSTGRLSGLGLTDAFADPFDSDRSAIACNVLAGGRLSALTEAEMEEYAAVVVEPLQQAWGRPSVASLSQNLLLDVELTRLALRARNPAVVANSAPQAVYLLRQRSADEAARVAREAIDLLDRHAVEIPVTLLRFAAVAAGIHGDGSRADGYLQRAVAATQGGAESEALRADRARVMVEQGRRLIITGDLQRAHDVLRQAQDALEAVGCADEAFVIEDDIARIHFRRGEYPAALRIWREVMLPRFRRADNVAAVANLSGRVADVLFRRGEHDEAEGIWRDEVLPIYQRLGEWREAAVTLIKIADVVYRRERYDEAVHIWRDEALPVLERLGDLKAAAIVRGKIADVMVRRAEFGEATRIWRVEVLPVLERIGDTVEMSSVWGRLSDIAFLTGDQERALEIRRDIVMPLCERNRDADGIAATHWGLGQILLGMGERSLAIHHMTVAFWSLVRLERADGVAVAGPVLGAALIADGHLRAAGEVLREALGRVRAIGDAQSAARIAELLEETARREEGDVP
ncbi:CHAT domain-containing protein [Actinoplanes flavus]|uniref:CHAT domain-containing protein n=1 Tax=Actinoplanes flavus TaxID=2820290 RepID=A0ABS3UYP6_9ACTN|nr:CHAT domain-containing protein [Actinoplanes flavus]MBO3743681.1 CHAT domain-containing protein [Actinoplanes flavus]